jgi:hypothetical protein
MATRVSYLNLIRSNFLSHLFSYYFCQNKCEVWHPSCVCCPETANNNPYLCLCIESYCLTGGAISGTRYYLNNKYGIKDTPEEKICNICLTVSVLCGFVGSIWSSVFDGCLGTQQVNEMKIRGDKVNQPCFA